MSDLRHYKFEDEKIFKLLEKKKKLLDGGKKSIEELTRLNTEVEKVNNKIQKIKDQLNPLVKEREEEMDIGEFEVVATVEIEDNKINVTIVDEIEGYKQLLRERNEKDSSGDSNSGTNTLETSK